MAECPEAGTVGRLVSSAADSYNVYQASVSGGLYIAIATELTSTRYAYTCLTSGTPYYYVVTAANSSGESAYSDEAGATTCLDSNVGRVGTADCANAAVQK